MSLEKLTASRSPWNVFAPPFGQRKTKNSVKRMRVVRGQRGGGGGVVARSRGYVDGGSRRCKQAQLAPANPWGDLGVESAFFVQSVPKIPYISGLLGFVPSPVFCPSRTTCSAWNYAVSLFYPRSSFQNQKIPPLMCI